MCLEILHKSRKRQDQNDKAHGFMVQGKAQDDKKQNPHTLRKRQDREKRLKKGQMAAGLSAGLFARRGACIDIGISDVGFRSEYGCVQSAGLYDKIGRGNGDPGAFRG